MSVETYHEDTVMYLGALENSVKTVAHLEECLKEGKKQGSKSVVLEYSFTDEQYYDTDTDTWQPVEKRQVTLDEGLITAIKGAGFGAYLTLREKGLQPTANNIMLNCGQPQELTPTQRKKLKAYDRTIKQISRR